MDIQNFYNNHYTDRGMKKWGGFILAEHSNQNEATQKKLKHKNPQKEQMDPLEIAKTLDLAILKNHAVTIQLEMLDENGAYYDDVKGVVKGFDDLGIFIGQQKVGYDEIRHIELYTPLKWTVL